MLKVETRSSENGCVKFTFGRARLHSFFAILWANYRPVTRPTHRPSLRINKQRRRHPDVYPSGLSKLCGFSFLRGILRICLCVLLSLPLLHGRGAPRELRLSREEQQVILTPHRQASQTRTGHARCHFNYLAILRLLNFHSVSRFISGYLNASLMRQRILYFLILSVFSLVI